MAIDLTVLSVGAFLVLVALIWKAYRVIDERLSEIQADIRELHGGVSHLFLLASKSEAKTASENAGKLANEADDLALLRSPGLEADLALVDGLCAKLITLVPPAGSPAHFGGFSSKGSADFGDDSRETQATRGPQTHFGLADAVTTSEPAANASLSGPPPDPTTVTPRLAIIGAAWPVTIRSGEGPSCRSSPYAALAKRLGSSSEAGRAPAKAAAAAQATRTMARPLLTPEGHRAFTGQSPPRSRPASRPWK
jgi:hypothetical protein